MKKTAQGKFHFTLISVLLDLITAVFFLASVILILGKGRSFTAPSFLPETTILPYMLSLGVLLSLLWFLHGKFFENPIFPLLPGLTFSFYLMLTLTLSGAVPISYCIGLMLITSIMIFLYWPCYQSLWQNETNRARILIVLQIILLIVLYITEIYIIFKNLPAVKFEQNYLNLFRQMSEMMVLLIVAAGIFFLGYFIFKKWHLPGTAANIIMILLALVNFAVLSSILVARVAALQTPTYDFGLFAQMFHYMDTTGQALSTLERNGLLSHFSVHLSPIYYLLLPFYKIWPNPQTLQILQVLVVLTGIIPLLLLCRHFALKKPYQLTLAFLYLFHPGIVGSSLYDLHENCFLAPLILWLLFFIEKEKKILMVIATLCIFAVKEDAAMYVVIIGFFMLISGKRKIPGVFLMITGVAYFIGAVYYLGSVGDGAMFGRYDNLLAYKSWGIAGLFVSILANPGYFLNELFIPGKLVFIFTTFPALGFLPTLQRRFSRMLLLIPLVVMNLMPSYPYQYEFFYQYHYATTVLMLYIIILFLAEKDFAVASEFRPKRGITGLSPESGVKKEPFPARLQKTMVALALCLAVVSSAYFTSELLVGRFYSVIYLAANRSIINNIKTELDKIPKSAMIQASGYFTTYLSDRDIVYDLDYNQREAFPHATDYVAVDQRFGLNEETKKFINRFLSDNYAIVIDVPDQILILGKP